MAPGAIGQPVRCKEDRQLLTGKGRFTVDFDMAMWEECAIDPASGQPLCGPLLDYGMPRSDNLPSFATEIVEVLSPTNPVRDHGRRRRRL